MWGAGHAGWVGGGAAVFGGVEIGGATRHIVTARGVIPRGPLWGAPLRDVGSLPARRRDCSRDCAWDASTMPRETG